MSSDWVEKVGIVSGIAMPFFNIPLILKLWKRKSARDISLTWAIGVWVCIVLMTPQALTSADPAFRSFGIVNVFFFSIVAGLIWKYRSN